MLKRILIHVGVAGTLSIIFTACFIFYHLRSTGRIVHTWEQPKEIEYQRNITYKLFVRERHPEWSLLGGSKPVHVINIGWDADYVHWFDCTFHAGTLDEDEIDAYIRRSTVEWTEAGVSIKQESGHVIFFPKKTFIGGR